MTKSKLTKQELPKGMLLEVALADIVPSKTNPRKEFKEEDLNDLAASIKSVGLMQPLVLHKGPKESKFGLISGERRFRAAGIAGLSSVPCMVYDKLSDEIVLEMQITENLQRQDINPMEESDAFQQLIGMGLATAEVIADKLGKSTKYVYDRIILQKVVPEVQQAIREGKLTITHGKQFARLPLFEQAKILDVIDIEDEDLTVQELKSEISQMFKLNLGTAVFDITSKSLVKKAGACTNCPKRSGCNLVLFDDVQQDDICFDADCWNNKVQAHIDHSIEKLKAEGKDVVLISTNWSTKAEALDRNNWNEFDEDDEEEQESNYYGIVVDLAHYGHSYKIGQVIKLVDDRAERAERAERQKNSPSIAKLTNSNSSSESGPEIEWDKEFARRVITAAWQLDHTHLNENEYNFLLDQVARGMSRLDLEHQIFICRLIGLQLAPEDAKDEIAFYKEQIHANRATGGFWLSVGGTGELLTLLYILELTDDFLDGWTDFQDEEEGHFKDFAARAQGVDVKSIAEAINTEANEPVIALPVDNGVLDEETQS